MKRHLIIFLCFLFLFISIPVSAIASTNSNYSYSTLSSIMDDYNITNNTRLFFKDADGIYYCFESQDGHYLYDKTNLKIGYIMGWSSVNKIWRFDSNNIYKEPELIHNKNYEMTSGKHYINYVYSQVASAEPLTFIACSVDVYDYDNTSEVVFTAGSQMNQPEATPPGQGSTPSQNQLLLTSVIQSTQLNQVLIEVVTLLPILIPTCITFLALRKGLKFLFEILKQV